MAKTKNPTTPVNKRTRAGKTTVVDTNASISTKPSRRRLLVIVVIFAVILFVIVAGWLVWELVHTNNELHKYQNSNASNQQADKLTTEVSKVAVLPSGEDPVIASVSDVSKLKGKPFFINAKDGDKVLIYKQAKKAILYRPSTKQIVEEAVYDSSVTQTLAK